MLFNSLSFAIFLPIVFVLYWLLNKKDLKIQNLLLIVASYYFYACWDYRFLFLLMFSTFLDYFTGIKMFESKTTTARKRWFWLSVIVNVGCLAFFKYYNFFSGSFAEALSGLGIKVDLWTLKVIMPVGISFYTFHGLSYVIDIYKGRIEPERNFVTYGLFVSFFPLLVAGPIERATHLLPQIKERRVFDYNQAVDGLRQILCGLFKKIVIADTCSIYANMAFHDPSSHSGSTLLIGAFLFLIQVYCDFSGYSDIAIGTARLFGFDLLRNFSYPFFSRNISEWWRRWNMSLFLWFKDYIYIPLGGNRVPMWKRIRNTFIIFAISGLWHGANITFIVYGLLNALFIVPSIIFNTTRLKTETVAEGKMFPSMKEFVSMFVTFWISVLAVIFFRAPSMHNAADFFRGIFSSSFFTTPSPVSITLIIIVIAFFIFEWLGREDQFALAKFGLKWPEPARYMFYYLLMITIFYYAVSTEKQEFIYFHF